MVSVDEFFPEQNRKESIRLTWDDGPNFAINRSTYAPSVRLSIGALEDDDLEVSRGYAGLLADEKTIISSATPLLSRAAMS